MDISDVSNESNTHTANDKAELISDPKSNRKMQESSPLHTAKKLIDPSRFKSTDNSYSFRVIVLSGIVFSTGVTVALILSIYLGPPHIGANGAVAADIPECSDVGLSVLQDGGNAVDAAVATTLCVGVINPQSSGLGGGGFMLVHDHKIDKSWGYDFREVAPALSTTDMFGSDENLLYNSGLSVAVPGELKGLALAHQTHGKLKWFDIVKPVADLARNGFNVTKAMAASLKTNVKAADLSAKMRKTFMRNGKFVEEGDFITRMDMASTLDIIALDPDALYSGLLAADVVNAVKAENGILNMEDLTDYSVVRREIIRSQFEGGLVATLQAPSAGPLLLLMLNMLKGFNWTEANMQKPKTYHQMIETFKFSYAHHGDLGDPSFNNPEITNNTLRLISDEFANKLREMINNETHPQEYYGANYHPIQNSGTSHISVVDAEELTVSLTTTINTDFGSKIITEGGIILNNEMASFTIPSITSIFNLPYNPYNLIEPGKRPLSSMTPAVVYNKKEPCSKRIIVGGGTGIKIISGVAEVIVNAMLFNQNLTYAIEKPRIHNQLYPDVTEYEAGVPDSVVKYLQDRGQNVQKLKAINIIQGVMKRNDEIFAHSDSRKGGKAAIYLQTT